MTPALCWLHYLRVKVEVGGGFDDYLPFYSYKW